MGEKPIQENFNDIKAVSGHVLQNLVFFADQGNRVIYRSSADGGDAVELTVNTRKVQGRYLITQLIFFQLFYYM